MIDVAVAPNGARAEMTATRKISLTAGIFFVTSSIAGLVLYNPAITSSVRTSSRRDDDVLDVRHVAPSGRGGLLRGALALPSVHVRRVPVPPVVRWSDRLE